MFGRPARVFVTLLALCLGAAGCSKGAAPPFQPTIALLTGADGFSPGTFGAQAASGLGACAAITGAKVTTDAVPGDFDRQLIMLATEKFDTVIAVGGQMAGDLANVALHYDDTHFAIIDGVVDRPNVTSVVFKDQDGSFLAGALAALVTRTKHVAFLGGADIPRLRSARAGFEAGVREIDPRVRVTAVYAGTFTDEEAGKRQARALYASGTDIVYVVAGRAGLGAIDAARTAPHGYVIGADSDQDALAPGKVLTSVLQRVDTAAQRICEETSAQKPTSGTVALGLAEGGVSLTKFRFSRHVIGASALARLDRIRAAIVAGSIVPPATEAEAASFRPVPLS